MRSQHPARGFTLIELMIVVAIIGILAGIAIPNFLRFQLRAKTSEAKTNLNAIRTAEAANYAEFTVYVAAQTSPDTYGGTRARASSDEGPTGGNFAMIGWAPEGLVYFQYSVSVAGGAYTVEAAADIDGNSVPQIWGFLTVDSVGNTAPNVLGCSGVYDPQTSLANLTAVVGPCGDTYGQSEF